MRFISLLAASLSIALIAGCKTAPSSTSSASAQSPPAEAPGQAGRQAAPNAATKAAATKANLAIEKLRLSELFRGTPVLFALQPDGSLRVEVPLNFSFDPGKTNVKAPLGAVLDRIVAGQLHEATQVVVRGPVDPAAKDQASLLGLRLTSLHDYLVGRGLAAERVVVSGSAGAAVVRIVVTDLPPA